MSATLSQLTNASTDPTVRESKRLTPLFSHAVSNYTKSRAKSVAKLSTASTSMKMLSHRNSTTNLTETVKQRKQLSEPIITHDLVMLVVRKYLLPLFEAESRSALSKTRSSVLGIVETAAANALKPLAAISGTVYGELKLSDRLMLELTDTKETAKRLEIQMNDTLQRKTEAEYQLHANEIKLSIVAAGLQHLRHQFDSLKLTNDENDLAKALLQSQLNELRSRYLQCEEDKQRLTTELHDEKALNDKYRNKATELEHRNSLLRMENDIIGERLKGLYDSFDSLLGRSSFEDKIRQEFKAASLANAALSKHSLEISKGLQETCKGLDNVKVDFAETLTQRDEMKVERDRLFLRLKKDVSKWEQDYKILEADRGKMHNEYTDLEKRHKIMSEEQDKTRQKLKQMRNKRRQFGEMEEKVCKNCGKTFYDHENFNWSCRIHFSQYSGEMWWCCGKQGQNSPGCRLSKHECKEDEDEEKEHEEGNAKVDHLKCTVTAR